ncbi:unnamed protein product [Rotaria magnacalcarata]|uniref:Trichohyalin-plectin-homology domain-containing protein n=12 Tax=Rotaria magnacalcarata TaxID=392030 RepID=A0A816GGV5_9BILA|nr:unnamed protein product [Rotaria magnacalcarata]CAF2052383.1 unnamed protein product [Rotaria magnacalcarata]CAF2055068.1 unnamed protein product [Rotaria magnacalcarata]CAF2146476.1 unnamed protein product [Rotaria magnacalcarata]CAF3787009.1 unnamed protein product [Rotaria magnacalcarata]
MAATLYPPLRIRDIPGPQPGQFGLLEKSYRPHKNLVAQNRELEAIRETRDKQNREAKTELNKIHFDELSSTKAFHAEVRREVERRLNHADHKLEERRERLRDLFATEEAQFLAETASSRESLSERIGKMRQKAKRIREEKESEHARLVQEKYDQRFRRDCAELRELQSKELDYELGNEHLWQMKEKFDRKKDHQAEEEFWTKLWYDDIAKKKEREDRDAQEAKAKSESMSKIIREQMQAIDADRGLQKSKRKEYSEAAWTLFRAQKDERAAEFQEKLRKQEEQKRVLDTVLTTKQKIQLRKVEQEKALDDKLAEETQHATLNDEVERRQRKFELRDENQRYRAYLEQRKVDEQRQQIELDRALQIEVDRQNAMRAGKLRAEKDKRNKLLQEVIVGRQQQLNERNERKAQENSEHQWQVDNMKIISEQVKLEDADREARNRTKRLAYRSDLMGQMSYEQRKKQEEEYEIQREQAEGMQAEIEYQKRLNFELQQTGVAYPHPIRQWYSAKTGTFYRPEKPAMFDDDNPANGNENFSIVPRRNTTAPEQTRPNLPVPIVYH